MDYDGKTGISRLIALGGPDSAETPLCTALLCFSPQEETKSPPLKACLELVEGEDLDIYF